jgi:predicted DNA-binding transcriptional regulator AlpA
MPRGLSRIDATAYIGVSDTLFDQMVADRRMPRAKQVNGRRVWDRRRVEQAFEALPDDEADGVGANPRDAYA